MSLNSQLQIFLLLYPVLERQPTLNRPPMDPLSLISEVLFLSFRPWLNSEDDCLRWFPVTGSVGCRRPPPIVATGKSYQNPKLRMIDVFILLLYSSHYCYKQTPPPPSLRDIPLTDDWLIDTHLRTPLATEGIPFFPLPWRTRISFFLAAVCRPFS